MFGFLHALTRQNALSLLVDLEHVKLRFLARPTKDLLENVSDVIHVVDRVIPADDQKARFQCGLRIVLGFLDRSGQQFRRGGLNHDGKLKDQTPFVEEGPESIMNYKHGFSSCQKLLCLTYCLT